MIYVLIVAVEVLILLVLSRRVHRLIGFQFYKLTKSKKLTVYLSALLFLPGTFVHEMSHFLAALFLLVPVGNVELLPKFSDSDNNSEISVTLGSVSIAKTDPIRRFLIGIAPLIFGFILVAVVIYLGYWKPTSLNSTLEKTFIDEIMVGYFVFTITNTMFSSKRDMEGSWIVLVFVLFVVLALWVIGVPLTIDIRSIVGYVDTSFLKSIASFMVVPVAFNVISIAALRRL